jgi:hypothetical protein
MVCIILKIIGFSQWKFMECEVKVFGITLIKNSELSINFSYYYLIIYTLIIFIFYFYFFFISFIINFNL